MRACMHACMCHARRDLDGGPWKAGKMCVFEEGNPQTGCVYPLVCGEAGLVLGLHGGGDLLGLSGLVLLRRLLTDVYSRSRR